LNENLGRSLYYNRKAKDPYIENHKKKLYKIAWQTEKIIVKTQVKLIIKNTSEKYFPAN
jgi:hypothetical protein